MKYIILFMYSFEFKQGAQWACIAHLVFAIYIFLYQSMTKGWYMPNINAFRPVMHGKRKVSSFLLYKPI